MKWPAPWARPLQGTCHWTELGNQFLTSDYRFVSFPTDQLFLGNTVTRTKSKRNYSKAQKPSLILIEFIKLS